MTEYDKSRVTIVILARNEEHTIAEAIANASGWCRRSTGNGWLLD